MKVQLTSIEPHVVLSLICSVFSRDRLVCRLCVPLGRAEQFSRTLSEHKTIRTVGKLRNKYSYKS